MFMKKILGVICLSCFISTKLMATNISVSVGAEAGARSVNNSPSLYNFSEQLLEATKNCYPYNENFTELNPIGSMLGGDLSVFVDIKGLQEDKCIFDVVMQLGILGRNIYHCKISNSQREALFMAMKDRSNKVITETFDSYMTVEDVEGNVIDKKTYKTTMTDNIFNIEWSKISQTCDIVQSELSEDEKIEMEKQFNMFDNAFLKSLYKCEKDSASRNVLFVTDSIEIKGWKTDKCIVEYKDFIFQLPLEKLESIKTWDDVNNMISDVTLCEYQPRYTYNNLLFAIDSCLQKDGSEGIYSKNNENITIKKSLEYKKTSTGCDISFINLLDRGNGEENYTKICKLPESYVQFVRNKYSELIKEYGPKSGDGYYYRRKSNEQTKSADELIWQEINKNQFCN